MGSPGYSVKSKRVVPVEGAKFDGGKNRYDLIPFDALDEVVKIYTFGSQKYDDRNWEKGIKYGRIVGAMFRHFYEWIKGSRKDHESGLHPLAHMAWGVMALLAYELRGMNQFDDITFRRDKNV